MRDTAIIERKIWNYELRIKSPLLCSQSKEEPGSNPARGRGFDCRWGLSCKWYCHHRAKDLNLWASYWIAFALFSVERATHVWYNLEVESYLRISLRSKDIFVPCVYPPFPFQGLLYRRKFLSFFQHFMFTPTELNYPFRVYLSIKEIPLQYWQLTWLQRNQNSFTWVYNMETLSPLLVKNFGVGTFLPYCCDLSGLFLLL